MRIHPSSPTLILLLGCALTIVLYFLGIAEAALHFWGRYLLPIGLVFLWGRRRDIYVVTALASALVAAEYWTQAAAGAGDLLINGLGPVLVLWAAAWLLAQRRQLQELMVGREQELDAQVKVRTDELQLREEELTKIFRANPGGIAITRQSDGCFLEANEAYLAMVGCTREQLIGRTSRELGILSAEQRDRITAAVLENGSVRNMDVQICSAPGPTVDAVYSVEQLTFGGEPCFLILAVDVTERTRLAAHAHRLAAIVEASLDAIMSADLDGTIVSLNGSTEDLYGIPAAAVVGRNMFSFTPPEYVEPLQAMLERVGRGEAMALDDVRWPLPGGGARTLSISLSPLRNCAEQITGFASIARDQTARRQLEADLRASEENYRALFNQAGDGIFFADAAGVCLDANVRACQMLGRTRAEVIGTHMSEMAVGATPEFIASVGRELAARGVANFEGQLRHRDGSLWDVEVTVAPVFGHRRMGIVRDISERKRLEAALRTSEARYRLLVDNAEDVIWTLDLAGRFTFVNPAVEHQLGYRPEEIIGHRFDRWLTPVSAAVAAETFAATAAQLWSGQQLEAAQFEGEQIRKDGTQIFTQTIGVPLIEQSGQASGFLGITRDVTEYKRAISALGTSEAQLRTAYRRVRLAVEAADLGLWNWNLADNLLDWDDRTCEMYAVTAEERAAGISYSFWRSRVHPDDLAWVESSPGDPARVGDNWSGTYRVALPGGSVRYIRASSVTEYDRDGKPWRVTGINRDVTDQIMYEQLLQDTNAVLEGRVAERTADLQSALAELQRASRLKDEFMAMISHELRTPLTGVLSMSELLEERIGGPLTDRQVTYVRAISQSGQRLLQVINGILSYTHLLAGKRSLSRESCNIAWLLATCAASLQRKAAAKRQDIAVEVAPPDLAITSDATALAEVLKHLLDNAVKFTPEGGQIGVAAHPASAPGAVDFVVWDTGIGIPSDQLKRIFGAFVQADRTLQRSHEGLGLGLAYVDQMVRLLGGTIAVESEPGQGSQFTVTLPAYLSI